MMAATRIESSGSIGVQPVSKDHGAGDERRHRAEQVAEHMDEGAAHVEILAVGALQQEERGDIHQQAEHGDDHHDAARHLRGGHQPLDRLVDDPRGDGEQREPVGEGDQHLEAVEAVGAPPVRRTPRQPEAEPGQRERGEVGEHVAGVGEKRERAGGDAAGHLGEHEERR